MGDPKAGVRKSMAHFLMQGTIGQRDDLELNPCYKIPSEHLQYYFKYYLKLAPTIEVASLQCSVNRGIYKRADCAKIFSLYRTCAKEHERALRKARREHRPARGCYKADFEIPEVPPVHPSVYE